MFNFFTKKNLYSLGKSKKILKFSYSQYKKHWKRLSGKDLEYVEVQMEDLEEAIVNKDQETASELAHQLEEFSSVNFQSTLVQHFVEFACALIFALILAMVVRQVWFELYQIPTGSMRPTFKEQDKLIVNKAKFSLNTPLKNNHLYFDKTILQRMGVVIFSGHDLNMADTDTTYFGIFPAKKRYIKRLIGKPGDFLYFYGGRVYGIDKDGRDLLELRENPWTEKLEYLPFLSLEGRYGGSSYDQSKGMYSIDLQHVNQAMGRLHFSQVSKFYGEILHEGKWIKDNPIAQTKPHNKVETYSDFLGIRNFAAARLLTKDELIKGKEFFSYEFSDANEGELYLHLRHTPSLSYPKPQLLQSSSGEIFPLLTAYETIIPLTEDKAKDLMDNMYTARFIVKNGKAFRYSYIEDKKQYTVPFKGIPDGTYEFYHGIAYEIIFGGRIVELPLSHPLYQKSAVNIQRLYNFGIEFVPFVGSNLIEKSRFPSRYAYFREGSLYLLGAKFLESYDPTLLIFNQKEKVRELNAPFHRPYVAFKDYGPPLKNGKIDAGFIKTFGVKVPDNHYFVLGDNHAMSGDSRYFGFVPEGNIEGAPSFLLWPPSRLGGILQEPYPCFTFSEKIVWGIVCLVVVIWGGVYVYNFRRPIFKKLSD